MVGLPLGPRAPVEQGLGRHQLGAHRPVTPSRQVVTMVAGKDQAGAAEGPAAPAPPAPEKAAAAAAPPVAPAPKPAPLQRVASIPVVHRADGAGAVCKRASLLPVAAARPAAACPPDVCPCCLPMQHPALRRPAADYLEIRNLRPQLTPQDSPSVATNNAGAGFGAQLQ